MGMGINMRDRMAKRAAEEIHDGMIVNLGIGIPSFVPNHLDSEKRVLFHAENGIVGMGPTPENGQEDENICNAGGLPVTVVKGASYCDSSIAFAMIRRGCIDLAILGALQVNEQGDLANWMVPGKKIPGMGGAMELAERAKKVIVLMNHCDKKGLSKIVPECSFPLTAERSVNMIITEMAVFEIGKKGLILTDFFLPFTIKEIREATLAEFQISENIRIIE